MPTLRRIIAAVAAVGMLAGIPTAAHAAEPPIEQAFLADINVERAANGLAPLSVYWDLVDDARDHSETMMAQNHLHHNSQLGKVTTGWYRLGENVGVGPDEPVLHRAFMRSPGHAANVLGDYNYAGIGVVRESETKIWVTVVFMKGPEGLSATPPGAPEPPSAPEPAPAQRTVASGPALSPTTVGLVDPHRGLWHLQDRDGQTHTFYYGNPGDYPMVGDWDCDGVETPGLYRQSDGYVYLRNSNTVGIADVRFYFGNPADVPVAGDFNGDGCDTVSLFRPSEGRVYVVNRLGSENRGLGAADLHYQFGNSTDRLMAADFDGDGIDTVARIEGNGRAHIRDSHDPASAVTQVTFGDPGDLIVAGDFSGNGSATLAAYRPSVRDFFLQDPAAQTAATAAGTAAAAHWLPIAGVFALD